MENDKITSIRQAQHSLAAWGDYAALGTAEYCMYQMARCALCYSEEMVTNKNEWLLHHWAEHALRWANKAMYRFEAEHGPAPEADKVEPVPETPEERAKERAMSADDVAVAFNEGATD